MKKILIILAVAAVAVVAWIFLRPGAAPDSAEVKPVAQVQVVTLSTRPITESLSAFGLVEPSPSGSRAVALGYDVVVERVAVSNGATVEKGDLLMEVEATPDAKLAMGTARSDAKVAEEGLAAARERYDLKLATNQDVLAAEQAADEARQKLASLEARGQAGDGRVMSPGAGIVVRLEAQPGAVVPAGTALATVAETGLLEAHLAVEAADAGRIRSGQPVIVAPTDRPDGAGAQGTVRFVGAAVDAVSGAVDVWASLPAGGSWFAGEHVEGAIHVQEKTALVAPRAAVIPMDGQEVLFTVKENKAVRHAVVVGIAEGDFVEVSAGDLHDGDKAVVLGNYELDDGMDVQISSSDAAPRAEKTPP
jgi:RND family efflux transporter MFP subunit